jgi:hypothetical protein
VDFAAAWTKTTEKTKSARSASASGTVNALDALTPLCLPFASRWDSAADRRIALRTPENLKALMDAQRHHNSARSTAAQAKNQRRTAKTASKNPLSTTRRAARVADKAARQHKDTAKGVLREARANYPTTLRARVTQLHATHAAGAGLASYLMSSPDLTLWPAELSASLMAANALALWLGRRNVSVHIEDGLSAEERQLVERLDPAFWVAHAGDRGLSGTVTTPPEVTPGGIRCDVRLDNEWNIKTFSAKADSIRALLGARTGLRMRITNGPRGGWVVISLATRQATDGTSSLWTPDLLKTAPAGMVSLGLDVETGEPVMIPFDERLLVSGASGTGKSWSVRPLMAAAHMLGDLALIDGKGEEANLWEKVCRTAVEQAEVLGLVDEAHGEMNRRRADMKRRGLSVWDGRQLTIVIDEGQVVLAQIMRDKPRLQRLVELSSLGRSRGVVLWWITQYPVTDGGAPGVHKLIAPNLLTRFSLRVASTVQAQVALDDCAHYAPQQIPEGREYRGHGYLKGYGARMIRTWTLDDAGVKKLEPSFWRSTAPVTLPAQAGAEDHRALRLVKAQAATATATVDPAELSVYLPAPTADAVPATNRNRVLAAVRAGARTGREVTDRTGLNTGTVSREVKALVKAGILLRATDGSLTAAAGEVSA